MSINLQEAIKSSLYTEKSAMEFYRIGAQHLQDPEARRVFDLLSKEEIRHAAQFYKLYEGADLPEFDRFINDTAAPDSGWATAIRSMIDDSFTEKKAMELAMEKEMELEAALRGIARVVEDPEALAVFEQNANETHNHYLMIESEYARVMKMVHESEIDTFVRE